MDQSPPGILWLVPQYSGGSNTEHVQYSDGWWRSVLGPDRSKTEWKKNCVVSLDCFINMKKIIFCTKRPRLLAIFSVSDLEIFFAISLDRFIHKKLFNV